MENNRLSPMDVVLRDATRTLSPSSNDIWSSEYILHRPSMEFDTEILESCIPPQQGFDLLQLNPMLKRAIVSEEYKRPTLSLKAIFPPQEQTPTHFLGLIASVSYNKAVSLYPFSSAHEKDDFSPSAMPDLLSVYNSAGIAYSFNEVPILVSGFNWFVGFWAKLPF